MTAFASARSALSSTVAHRTTSAIIAAAACLTLLAGETRAADYRLGPQDRLRVKLVEWRPGNGEAVGWDALADDYTVSAAGRIAVPMLGEFDAGGKTPSALSVEIGERLRERVSLSVRPEVSVEVQSYRPFYILGAVDKPGEYAFRPELTALQAVSLAGGLYRPADAGLLRLERDRITALGLLEEARSALGRALVREARLVGELSDAVEAPTPKDPAGDGLDPRRLEAAAADETAIARARLATYQGQVRAAERLRVLFDDQIKALSAKIASQERQVDISRREMQAYTALTNQGLAVTSRQFSLERAVSDAEGKRLDHEMALLTARQERQKVEQTLVDLGNERRAKILDEIGEVRGAIDTLRAKLKAQAALVDEAGVAAPRAYLDRERALHARTAILVLTRRGVQGEATARVVDDMTALEPGDVLRVEAPGLLPPAGGRRDMTAAELR